MNNIFLLLLGFYLGFIFSSWYSKRVTDYFFKNTNNKKPENIKWKYDSEGRPVDD